MSNYRRDDSDSKALRRLLNEEQLAALLKLVGQTGALFFDSVAGKGCWQWSQRRTAAQHLRADHGAHGGRIVQTRVFQLSLIHFALTPIPFAHDPRPTRP